MSSIRGNVVANYAGQIFVASVGIFTLPIFLKLLGRESYGLIGVFTMLQAWIQLLDGGLSTTIAREASRFNNKLIPSYGFKRLFSIVLIIFLLMAALFLCVINIFSSFLITKWSAESNLDYEQTKLVFNLIVISVAVRWLANPFRSVLIGIEKQIKVNLINVVFTVNRYIFVLFYCFFRGFEIYNFFIYQVYSSILELIIYIFITKSEMYRVNVYNDNSDLKYNIKQPLFFALSAGFAYGIWVFISQADKLILTKTLSLTDYAIFSVAITLSAGISMLIGPMGQAILPSMTINIVNGNIEKVKKLYFDCTRYMGCVVIPIVLTLSFFSEDILYFWTRDHDIASGAKLMLMLYSIGNGLLAISTFQYYLQYSFGDLNLHYKGNLLLLIVFLPFNVLLGIKYGGVGTGVVWVLQNSFYLFVWSYFVHKKFGYPHLSWILKSLGPSLFVCLSVGFVSKMIQAVIYLDSLFTFVLITVAGLSMVILCFYFHPELKTIIKRA